MSLIDEALKRARQEATRQDAEARELRYRQVPVIPGLRQRPRRSWLLPVVIAACLTAGVGIGLGLSFSRNNGEDVKAAALPPETSVSTAAPVSQPVVQETREAPPPPVVEEAEQPPAITEKEESPAPVVPKPAAPSAPEPVPQEEPRIADMRTREISLTPAAPRPQPEEPPAPEPAAPPAPTTPAVAEPSAPAPTPVAPGEVRTYQQEMPLPGGGALRLNGIAFSERPVALFGDKVVAPGETVSGYKVISIEARRVRLEGAGGTVVVELQ